MRSTLKSKSLGLGIVGAGLVLLAWRYSRTWPFPPWPKYSREEIIRIQGAWVPSMGLQSTQVAYETTGERVLDPVVRYEVVRYAQAFVHGATEPDGRVEVRGRFIPASCEGGLLRKSFCREVQWRWLVPVFEIVDTLKLEGYTALMDASWRRDFEAVRRLLRKGAKVNARDSLGRTAVWYARSSEIIEVLVAAGADIEARDERGGTPLMHAAHMREVGRVKDYLAAGANPNARDKEGKTAMMLAARQPLYVQQPQGTEAVKLLLAAGGDPNARDRKGVSALMIAAAAGQVDLVKALLAARGIPRLEDKEGRTALDYATQTGHVEIENMLRDAGSNP